MEFSKIIVIAVSILTAIISCFAMIAMLIIQDLSALPVLITAIFAAFTAGTGFYYNKAKAENLDELGSKDGINLMRQNLEKLYKKGDK
mgnify:CR=1 FL=1